MLTGLAERRDVHGVLLGRVVRVLTDAEVLADAPDRVHRALSYGSPAADKAAWVDGFFSDGALLLIHDTELLGLLDRWVDELDEQEFVDVLPLVRRTFATFSVPERRIDRRAGGRAAPGGSTPTGRGGAGSRAGGAGARHRCADPRRWR